MNILLINMPIRIQAKPNIVPTGIGILSSMAKSMGHSCDVLDLNVFRPPLPLPNVEKRLLAFDHEFDLICLSGMITTLKWQKKLASLVRRLFPESVIVSGGGLASDFEHTLFEWIPELDAVCVGEGEEIFPAILKQREKLRGSKSVLGPEITPDLDKIPPVDWDAFDMETYLANPVWGAGAGNSSWTPFESKRSVNLISSRGCPITVISATGAQPEAEITGWRVRNVSWRMCMRRSTASGLIS